MSFIIGFTPGSDNKKKAEREQDTAKTIIPRKSLVRVYFAERGFSCTYYNDLFDLNEGDIVFVEGKCEGYRGIVTEVSYNFKIRLSDYKRVVSIGYTNVTGELYLSDTHYLAFDRGVLDHEKVLSWYKSLFDDEDELVSNTDKVSFTLSDFKGFKVSPNIYERGEDYYLQDRVVCIELDSTQGRAIVEGSKVYTVEFTYKNGEITLLLCDCYCVGVCKHQVAAMLQLRDLVKSIDEEYEDKLRTEEYVCAVQQSVFNKIVLNKKNLTKITLG